jgi:hypothetical protein
MTRPTKPAAGELDPETAYDLALAEWRAKHGALAEALYKPAAAPAPEKR